MPTFEIALSVPELDEDGKPTGQMVPDVMLVERDTLVEAQKVAVAHAVPGAKVVGKGAPVDMDFAPVYEDDPAPLADPPEAHDYEAERQELHDQYVADVEARARELIEAGGVLPPSPVEQLVEQKVAEALAARGLS